MGERAAARIEVPELDKPAGGLGGLPAHEDGYEEARVIDLGWSRQIEEARKRQEHWTEVELVLEMWERVAHSWNNETLMPSRATLGSRPRPRWRSSASRADEETRPAGATVRRSARASTLSPIRPIGKRSRRGTREAIKGGRGAFSRPRESRSGNRGRVGCVVGPTPTTTRSPSTPS